MNGLLEVGSHSYSAIVMPNVEVIPLNVLKKLKKCAESGITIFWVDATPELGTRSEEHGEVKNISSTLIRNDNPIADLKKITNKDFNLDIKSDDNKLTIGKYERNERRIYFIVNDSGIDINVDIKSGKCKIVKIYNPVDGNIMEEEIPLKKRIGKYEGLFVVEK